MVLACVLIGAMISTLPADTEKEELSKLRSCRIEGVDEELLCGTLEVFENREKLSGRKIPLNIVVLPAKGDDRVPDPLFHLEGGPGVAGTNGDTFYTNHLADAGFRVRDVVLVDLRGTGKSNPLHCNLIGDAAKPQNHLKDMYPPEAVSACREELSHKADLTQYTTTIAMDDMDDVRAWLGYDRINLLGISHGTRAAQVYMRRYPDRVRSAVFLSYVAPGAHTPSRHAPDSQQTMEHLLDECRTDADCAKAYPEIRRKFKELIDRLEREPARVNYARNGSNDVELVIRRDVFASKIRESLYFSKAAARVPMIIHHAHRGDFGPFLETAISEGDEAVSDPWLAEGYYLSVTCTEDVPFIDWAKAEEAAKGTFLGDYRLAQQRRACLLWPRGEITPGFSDPFISDTPLLIITGSRDLGPPEPDAEIARHFQRGRQVVVPGMGHLPSTRDEGQCFARMVVEFLDKADPRAIDTSCVEQVKRKPSRFLIEPKSAAGAKQDGD